MSKVVKVYKHIATFLLACAVMLLLPLTAKADNGKATVKVEGAYIRETASTSAKVAASVVKGNVLEVISSETDSAGNTWYKVVVDANTNGYIRSDLVEYNSSSSSTSTETKDTSGNDQSTSGSTNSNDTTGSGNTTSSNTSSASGKVTVTVEGAYIRETASTSAKVVGSAVKGNVLEIVGKETDSAGNTWYKIAVDAKTYGFIRSDLVSTNGSTSSSGNGNSNSGTTTTTTTTTTTQTAPEVTPVEPTKPTPGEVLTGMVEVEPIEAKTTGSVNVRKGPSTSTDKVGAVDGGMLVTVSGYAKEGDNVWYYMTYNSTTAGYIRGDFLALNGVLVEKTAEPEPEPEPIPVPEPEPEPEQMYYDYEVDYELDENGDTVWYLKDYTEGTKNPILELLDAKKELETTTATYQKALRKKKVVNVILIILLILLLAGAGVGAFFFRRWYFGYDESEEPVSKSYGNKYSSNKYTSNSTRGTVVNRNGTKTNATSSTRRTASEDEFKIETVGGARISADTPVTSAPASDKPVRVDEGHVRMPDGTIKRAVVGVRQPDGSIKLSDGRIRKPDGTIITPNTPAQEAAPVSKPASEAPKRSAKPRNFVAEDDDMEFGFLNISSSMDEE